VGSWGRDGRSLGSWGTNHNHSLGVDGSLGADHRNNDPSLGMWATNRDKNGSL
jgi:hypothetical protein